MPMRGGKQHIARLRKLAGPTMERNVGRALFAGGERIATRAQIEITAGAVSGAGHVASLPGEFPNNDEGTLANGIEVVQKAPLLVEVSSNAPHAKPLEEGTSKMAARPHMAPARDLERREVVALVERAVNSVVKGSRTR